ncbi:Immunoglobulin superfamily member 10 [Labeo rohita]|nr:Immunoglobulin superfamily member 10 [Labeo rohita]
MYSTVVHFKTASTPAHTHNDPAEFTEYSRISFELKYSLKTIYIMFSGCDLVANRKTVAVTGYSGESVVLPCSCTELLAKPEQIQWMYFIAVKYKEIYPNEQTETYKNRVKLFNSNTPGNLSLHISALTTEDEGDYQCYISSQQDVTVRLTVLHAEVIISNVKQTVEITGYTGGSVVLPCSCADPQSTVTTVTWQFEQGLRWIQVSEDEKYSSRHVLFNEHSPTNLSLLISDLRINDQGYYKCLIEPNTFTYVDLKVKGCDLFENKKTVAATGYSGESVVLPCSCTELLAKPEQIQWMYFKAAKFKEIYPNKQIKSYENRVKLLNPSIPGDYQCYVSSHQVVSFTLTLLHAEEKPRVHIMSLTTHEPSQQTQELPPSQLSHHTPQYVFILVTVFSVVLLLAFLALSSRYGKAIIKGVIQGWCIFIIEHVRCIVSNVKQTKIITGYTGGSVVLPCSCADPQSTVTTVTWEFQSSGNRWIPVFEDEKYSGRRVLFNEHSPTDLSLLITDLRTNDQGYYKCLTESNTFTYVDLKVTECDLVENGKTVAVTGYSGESVVLPCSCTELLAKPEQIQWMYFIAAKYKEIYPNEQTGSYKNRVKLLNPNTPGNLSLHISALTTEDQGHYQCYISSHQAVSVRLTVLHVEDYLYYSFAFEETWRIACCFLCYIITDHFGLLNRKTSYQYNHFNNTSTFTPNTRLLNFTTSTDSTQHHTKSTSHTLFFYELTLRYLCIFVLDSGGEKSICHAICVSPEMFSFYWECFSQCFYWHYWHLYGGDVEVRGRNNKKATTVAEEQKREQDNQDDVMYSAVVYVKTTSTPGHTCNGPAEFTQYAPFNKNRVKLLNLNTPGNLSLHISALTTGDEGDYQCYVSSQCFHFSDCVFCSTVTGISGIIFYMWKGCIVSDERQRVKITGYTGGSVVLPCSCADSQSTATTVTWEFEQGNRWIQVFEDEKYNDRRVLFNEHSPTNLSLLITDLRMNDQGYYRCLTESNTFTDVDLNVKGCDLVEKGKTVAATGYSGESVVLPCSCTELLAKPEQIQWMYFIAVKYKEIYPNEQIKSYENRVKLLNSNTPGNLSLYISALTTEDEGDYQCYISSHQVVAIRLRVLHVEGSFLLLSDYLYYSFAFEETCRMTCCFLCYIITDHFWLLNRKTSHQYNQLNNTSTFTPNTRLLNFTTSTDSTQHHTKSTSHILLGKKHLSCHLCFSTDVFILLGVFFSVLLLALLAFIWWRCRGGRNEKKATTVAEEQKREQDNQDDVMYSAVAYVKTTSTPAHTHNDPAEFTEYARINFQLCFALGRVGHHHTVPGGMRKCDVYKSSCIVSDDQDTIEITGYTGGSVVLPCFCADSQSTVMTFAWEFDTGNTWIPVFEDEKYSGRRVLFNEHSPTNLSLLITDLGMKDKGYYKCLSKQNTLKTVELKVKGEWKFGAGCDLVEKGKTVDVTGYSGESVVLPCSCTELLAKPEQIQWNYWEKNKHEYEEIYPDEDIESYKNRVKLLNKTSPGNLSLHISALTTDDEGGYQCVMPQQEISFRLHVAGSFLLFLLKTTCPHNQFNNTSTSTPNTRLHNFTTSTDSTTYTSIIVKYLYLIFKNACMELYELICSVSPQMFSFYWECFSQCFYWHYWHLYGGDVEVRGRNDKRATTVAEEQKREQDNQDDVMYSAVAYVKTTSTPAHTHNDPAEFTQYAPFNDKR